MLDRLRADNRRGGRGDKGSVVAEMALILPLLMMLLVGTITTAVAHGQDNSLHNAAREASRFGATYPGPIDISWLRTVRDVARSAAAGDLSAGVPGQYICVAYVDGSDDQRLTDTGGAEASANSPCFDDGRPAGEPRVQVVAQREGEINAVLFSLEVTLSSPAAARYEREE